MSLKVAEMSQDELREIIESSIERKLNEFFSDPDAALEINESLREQLLRQHAFGDLPVPCRDGLAWGEPGMDGKSGAVRRQGVEDVLRRDWHPVSELPAER